MKAEQVVADEEIGMTPQLKMAEQLHEQIRARVREGVVAGYERAYDDTTSVSRKQLQDEVTDAIMDRLGYVCVEFAEAAAAFGKERAEAMNVLRVALADREAYLSNLTDVQERCTALLEENRALKQKNS